MRALNQKLVRDLTRMWPQVLTIALIVAAGVACFVACLSTYDSLVAARDDFYREWRFADVFAKVRRAPDRALENLRRIPGVSGVEGRIVMTLRVEIAGYDEPVRGGFVSLPRHEVTAPPINAVFVRAGRLPIQADEALVSELFAKAHGLRVGSAFHALAAGRRARFRVSGIAASPEFLWVIEEGSFLGDNRRYGIFWMRHDALATATGFAGAFNDVVATLDQGTPVKGAIAAIDRALEPWGSSGALGRDKQTSNRIITQEIGQLRGSAIILPTIFLAVGAFLVNVLLSRIVQLQREQIAALKAVGYRSSEVGRHFLLLALAMVIPGTLLGIGLGGVIGEVFIRMYENYFRFPRLELELNPAVVLAGVVISLGSAGLGAVFSVRRAVKLAPAEAMRPESPERYDPTVLERLGVHALLPVAVRMVLRDIERRPFRAFVSAVGIALATAILVSGYGSFDSMGSLLRLQFEALQREDLAVTFSRPVPRSSLRTLEAVEGVIRVEGQRTIGARLRHRQRERETGLTVVPLELTLRQRLGEASTPALSFAGGISISRALATALDVGLGDTVDAELLGVLAQRRTGRSSSFQRHPLRVQGIVDDFLGLSAYVDEETFLALTGEPRLVTEAFLDLDEARVDQVSDHLARIPNALAIVRPEIARESFRHQVTDLLTSYQITLAMFAMILCVGVVYNNARIALVTRSRELATLRILGFSKEEVRSLLMTEQLIQASVGIPPGLILGKMLVELALSSADPELFRLPVDIYPQTYASATLIVFASSWLSARLVGRRAQNMDLVAVLKARD
ncbi:MAG: ABC transporter permease [Deltaproteobacteria bacterium]|nr:ABC transporter permease [Deltaproteobacteria bacterium]